MTYATTRRGFTVGLAALIASPAIAEARRSGRYDAIVRGGMLFDGLGGVPREADLGIVDGKIAAIGNLVSARAALEIDARGQAVAPGFINMLSWANESLIEDGRSQSDIRQGVTLEVMGEGWSMGPYNAEMKRRERKEQDDIKFDIGWTSLSGYLGFLEAKGISCNVASFVGATTVRQHQVGYDDVRATPEQLRGMQDLVRAEMRSGALGVGSSLIYAPGNFANTDELVALTEAAAEFGGGYISHMRSEGRGYLESIDELIEIGRRAKTRVQMYHIKPSGRDNWGKADAGLARMAAARRAGIDVSANLYTYTAGSTGLYATIPLWVQQGGHDAFAARLKDAAVRARVIAEMRGTPQGWENLLREAGSAERVMLIGFKNPKLKPLTGMTLAQVAAQRATSPEDTIIDLIVEDDSRVDAVYFLMTEENIRKNIQWPWTMLGSDAASLAPEGKFLLRSTHPRAYGNFARFLGKYIREEKVIGLAEGIRRLTSLPAQQIGIKARGRLAPGYAADIVVFDPAKIADTATYDKPHAYAVGVSDVLVNGVAVLRGGEHTDARPGRYVKGPGWRSG